MRKENLKTRPIALTLQRVEPRVDSLEKIFLARRIRDPVKPNPVVPVPARREFADLSVEKDRPACLDEGQRFRRARVIEIRFVIPRDIVDGRDLFRAFEKFPRFEVVCMSFVEEVAGDEYRVGARLMQRGKERLVSRFEELSVQIGDLREEVFVEGRGNLCVDDFVARDL